MTQAERDRLLYLAREWRSIMGELSELGGPYLTVGDSVVTEVFDGQLALSVWSEKAQRRLVVRLSPKQVRQLDQNIGRYLLSLRSPT